MEQQLEATEDVLIATLSDIDFDTARRAYLGTSFDSEKRARAEQEEYVDFMNTTYSNLKTHVKTIEQQRLLDKEFGIFKQEYINRMHGNLRVRSGLMNTMVAGPANFPVERQKKKSNAYDKHMSRFDEWSKKAIRGIEGNIRSITPPELIAEEKWKSIKRTIDCDLRAIREVDAGAPFNRSAFINSLSGWLRRMLKNGQVGYVAKALLYIKDQQTVMEKPVFTEKHSIWTELGAASNKAPEPVKCGQDTVEKYDGTEVVKNYDIGRVQILFDTTPGTDVLVSLKKSGWKYSHKNNAWQRMITNSTLHSASSILSRHYKKDSPAEGVSQCSI